jgi:hypothetical protein
LSYDFDGTVTIFEQQRSFAVKAELFSKEILRFEAMGVETVTHTILDFRLGNSPHKAITRIDLPNLEFKLVS